MAQSSSGSRVPIAPLMPPRAHVVCASPWLRFPNTNTSSGSMPCWTTSMAARAPAAPAPTTSIGTSVRRYGGRDSLVLRLFDVLVIHVYVRSGRPYASRVCARSVRAPEPATAGEYDVTAQARAGGSAPVMRSAAIPTSLRTKTDTATKPERSGSTKPTNGGRTTFRGTPHSRRSPRSSSSTARWCLVEMVASGAEGEFAPSIGTAV